MVVNGRKASIYLIQLRHYDIPDDDDFDGILSFLPPIIADESRIGTQIFFRKKDLLNSASKNTCNVYVQVEFVLTCLSFSMSSPGAFLKQTARRLRVDTLEEEAIRVKHNCLYQSLPFLSSNYII